MNSVLDYEKPDPDERVSARPRQSTIDAIVPKKKKPAEKPRYKTLTLEDTQWLIEQSRKPFEPLPERMFDKTYPTYSMEEASRLVREHLGYNEHEKPKGETDGFFGRRQDTEQEPTS